MLTCDPCMLHNYAFISCDYTCACVKRLRLAGEVAVAAGGGNEGAMAVLKVKLQTAAALVTQVRD